MYRLAMRARRYSEPYLTYAELLGEMYPRWSSQDAVMIKQILDELDPAQEKRPMIETTRKLSKSQALIDKYTLPEITDKDVDRYADSLKLNEPTKAKLIPSKPTHTKDDFLDRLIMFESSGKADAEITIADGRRFVGKLQFGDARLQDYQNATGNNFTQDEFIQDMALQDKVAAWHLADLDMAIDALGDDAKGYDRDGLRSIGHLGGKGGMRKFVKSDGKYNPADELGTSLQDYYDKFSSKT